MENMRILVEALVVITREEEAETKGMRQDLLIRITGRVEGTEDRDTTKEKIINKTRNHSMI